MVLDPSLKSLVDLNPLFVTIMVSLVILDLIALSFKLLKESKEKRNLNFLEVVLCKLNWIWWKIVSFWRKFLMFLPFYLCASSVLILPTLVSLLMRHSFQTIILFGWEKGSYGWAFILLVIDLILSIFVGLHCHAFMHLASLYMHCLCLYWSYFTCSVFEGVQKFKNP